MAATDLERLVVSLDADIRKFEKELKRANNVADGQFRQIERRGTQSAKNLSNSFSKLSLGSIGKNAFAGFIAGAASALAPVAILTAAINGTKRALADFGKLADDIKPTGLKPEIYQALSLAALEAGSSQEELNAALLIFAKNVGLAQSGTGPLVAGLKKLNPELLKNILAAKDQDERVRLVADAMNKAGNATRQAALASVAFGRGGVKIVEALKSGSSGIDEFIRRGKEMGILLTEGDLAEADALADKMDVLAFAINTNLNKALVRLAPLLVAGAEGLSKFAKAAADLSNKEINFEGLSTLLGPQLRLLDPSGNLGAGLSAVGAEADALVGKLSNGSDAVKELATNIRQLLANSITIIPPEQLASLDALISKLDENGEGAAELKRKLLELAKSNPEFAALATRLDPLLEKLIAIQAAAGGAQSALANLEGNRAGGFAFQSQRESETGAARDFFTERQSDAGRSSAARELDARSEQVLNEAKERGIELTEEAARAEAERELALEHAQKEREKTGKDTLKEANDERERQNELIRDTIANLQEENAALGFETEHINDSNAAREEARVVFEELNKLTAEGITITDDLRASVEREAKARGQQVAAYDAAAAAAEAAADAAADAADKLEQAQEDLLAQQAEVNDAFRDSMKGFISDLAHGKSLTDALTSAMGKLGDKLLDMALDNLFGKSGDSGFGLIGELFGTKSSNTTGGSGLFGNLFGGAAKTDIASFKTNSTLASVLGAPGASSGGNISREVTGAVSKGVSSGLNAAGDVPGTIWNFFTNKGLQPHQVAGILGNVNAESAFNPLAAGDKVNGIPEAFGLFQHNDRKGSLFSAIGGKGNLGDVNKQLEFAWKELQTTETKALSALKASTNVREATGAFAGFERPKGFSWDNPEGAHNFEGRLSGAEEALAKFGGTTGEATSAVSNLGQGSASALGSLSQGVGEATSSLGQFGTSLSSFLTSSMGGGSSWFKNLSGMFGGSGGAFGFMNSISPAATSSIIGAGGGFTGLFADGGYTGDMGTSTPAGIVHGGEFVINAAATARNRGLLEALNNGMPGYAAGGFVLPRMRRLTGAAGGNSKGTQTVNITVNTPDAPSFMRSQNQIAAKTAATVDRTFRTQ